MMWPFNNYKDPEILLKELENPDPSARERAFRELKDHPDLEADRAILAAIEAYDQIDKEILLPLIDIAGSRQILEALPILGNILKGSDYQERESAIQALATIPTQESLDILVPLLSDKDPAIKQIVQNIISEIFGQEALGALLRAVPADKNNPLYFEIVAVLEDLDLFTKLKENFEHPDLRVKDFNFNSLAKFHRPDFIPLYLDFYSIASKQRKDQIIDILGEYSPIELIPYFTTIFTKGISDPIFQLADHLIFARFASGKEEILDFACSIYENRYRTKVLLPLLKQLDPFVFLKALNLINDAVPDVRIHAHTSLTNLVKGTFKRLHDKNEPNKAILSKLYEQWEKHLTQQIRDKDLPEDKRKNSRRLFYAFVKNKHAVIKPFIREFFENNFQETYFVVKEWPFDEQFELFHELVNADPSFAALLLAVAQGNLDEGLWRIILKLISSLDEEDKVAFRKNLLTRNRTISLEQFIKDNDASVRAAAIEFATELKVNGLIDLLKNSSKDPSPEVRLKALECLTKQNYPQTQTLLVEALNDPEEEVAFFALTQLKEHLGASKMAPYLARFINSSSEKIRDFSLQEIAELSKKRYKANFSALKPEVRKLAAKVIQKLDQGFADQIVQELSSLDPKIRLKAAQLLENIQIDSKGKDALLAAMKDPSKLVRAAVVRTLGVMGDSDLIKHLISFFNDPDSRVRANTIEAISALGDRQAIQILLPFLQDTNNRIKANAIVGIRKIGNVNVIPVIQKMLTDKDPNMQASALWALGEVGDLNYLNFIYPYLNNTNEMLRFNAIRSISKIKPEMLQPYMPNLRQDPSAKIRKLVASVSFKVL